MSGLLDPQRRRTAREAKGRRKEAILAAAAELVRHRPFTELTLSGIDRKAGLKPGLASMYFGTLPDLLLALLRRELAACLEAVVGGCANPMESVDVARAVGDEFAKRPLLARLLSAVPMLVDTRSADAADTERFERWHLEALRTTARKLSAVCAGLSEDAAFALLRRAEFLAAALVHEIDPGPAVLLARSDPERAALHPDGARELTALLAAALTLAEDPPRSG